jgi:hypothetical protein
LFSAEEAALETLLAEIQSDKSIREEAIAREEREARTGWSPLKVQVSEYAEFLEHINEKDLPNVIDTFIKSKYVMFTCAEPGQGGHHHVNCQFSNYWINLLESNSFKFKYENDITQKYRSIAKYPYFKNTGLIFKNLNYV